MRVLILSVTAGYGHHAAANAIKEELILNGEKESDVLILDITEYFSRLMRLTMDKGYNFSLKHFKEAYRLGYKLAERRNHNSPSKGFNFLQLFNAIDIEDIARDLLLFNPDIIVCTHIFAAQVVNELKLRRLIYKKCIGIVTDYTIHPYWESVSEIEHIVIANPLLEGFALKRGIEKEKLCPFGIPVNSKFNRVYDKLESLTNLGFDTEMFTVLLMGGSLGYSAYEDIIRELNTLKISMRLLVVCGTNNKQYNRVCNLKKELEESNSLLDIVPYQFRNDIEVLMSVSDCIITKPGGLTVTEALVKGLPILLVNPLPGHEERNVDFLVNSGVALVSTKNMPISLLLYMVVNNQWILENIRERIRYFIPTNATKSICSLIYEGG